MGHTPKIAGEEQNDWNLEQAVRETEEFFHRPTAADDRNHKRPEFAKNSGMFGEAAALHDTRGVSNKQTKTIKQVRSRLHGRQDHSPEEPPDHNNLAA